jgi:hypothetical protein
MADDGVFQSTTKMLIASGVHPSSIMAYVLFGFNDSPVEAMYRASECNKLGIFPYPQHFTRLDSLTRERGEMKNGWTKRLAKAFRLYWLFPGVFRKQRFAKWALANKMLTSAEIKLFHE